MYIWHIFVCYIQLTKDWVRSCIFVGIGTNLSVSISLFLYSHLVHNVLHRAYFSNSHNNFSNIVNINVPCIAEGNQTQMEKSFNKATLLRS